jgi:hypothetical protein
MDTILLFTIGAVIGIFWSLWVLFEKQGLPWDQFNPRYVARAVPVFIVFVTVFQNWLAETVIPNDPVKAIPAGFLAGMAADVLIKYLWDSVNILFGGSGPK